MLSIVHIEFQFAERRGFSIMANKQYSWKSVQKRSGTKSRGDDQLNRWLWIAVIFAVISHAVVLFAMHKMPVYLGGDEEPEELSTEQVVVRSVEDREYLPESENEKFIEPPQDAEELLTDLDMLEDTPTDFDINFSPDIEDPEMKVDLVMQPIEGDEFATAEEITYGADLSADLENLGSTEDFIEPEQGQIIIDAGIQSADAFDPDAFSKEMAKGEGGDAIDSAIDGFTPLAEMTRLSSADLNKAKGMIGSDLLYDFGKSTLRESAKNSLLKLVLIIDKNPEMYCWIEGHTDLIGDDESNRVLSLARAQAVKTWLVESMKISPDKLYTRAYGETQPIVKEGDQDQQALNRRVEIKMRKLPPPAEPIIAPPVRQEDLDVVVEDSKPSREPRLITPKRNPNLPESPAEALEPLPEPPVTVVQDTGQTTEEEDAAPSMPEKLESNPTVNPALVPLPEPVVDSVEQPSANEPVPVSPESAPKAILVEEEIPAVEEAPANKPVESALPEPFPASPLTEPAAPAAIPVEPIVEPSIEPEPQEVKAPRAVPVEEVLPTAPVVPEPIEPALPNSEVQIVPDPVFPEPITPTAEPRIEPAAPKAIPVE